MLRAIALDGPIARTTIAERLGVSGATVTALTRELLEAGLVVMAGKEPAVGRRGRPQEMLAVASQAATILGVKVAEDRITGVSVDLTGEVTDHFSAPFQAASSDAVDQLAALLRATGDSASGRLVGIGLGVPGTVATGAPGAATSPMLGWRDLPVGTIVGRRLGVPVMVANDVNALVTGQRLYGVGRGVGNFFTVTLGRGIGMGIVLDHAVRVGRGGAGEFGHTRAMPDGPRCECGRRGCLEALVSEPALLRQAVAGGLVDATACMEDLRDAAETSPEVTELFITAGRRLGDAVADLVNILAPEQVVLAGEGIDSWSLIAPGFRPALEDGVLAVHRDVPVIVDTWEHDTWGRGAAALVLDSVFEPVVTSAPASQMIDRLHRTSETRTGTEPPEVDQTPA